MSSEQLEQDDRGDGCGPRYPCCGQPVAGFFHADDCPQGVEMRGLARRAERSRRLREDLTFTEPGEDEVGESL